MMKLKKNIKLKKDKKPKLTLLTRKTHNTSHKTMITLQKAHKKNYEAQFSIYSMLRDKVENKIN